MWYNKPKCELPARKKAFGKSVEAVSRGKEYKLQIKFAFDQ